MNKKSNIIKIVKEDILRISFINEAIEELEREGLIKSRQIFLS